MCFLRNLCVQKNAIHVNEHFTDNSSVAVEIFSQLVGNVGGIEKHLGDERFKAKRVIEKFYKLVTDYGLQRI